MRVLYILGWGYIAIAGLLLYQGTRPVPAARVLPFESQALPMPGATTWWERVRQHCNPVEVTVTLSQNPPGNDLAGQALAAACYALAGKIEKAAQVLQALPQEQRAHAANIVFNEGHPVADMGDDEAAGPIMELVLRYTPDNYMALYHAGMAQYRTNQPEHARRNLERFLELYRMDDGWTRSAQQTLRNLNSQVIQ